MEAPNQWPNYGFLFYLAVNRFTPTDDSTSTRAVAAGGPAGCAAGIRQRAARDGRHPRGLAWDLAQAPGCVQDGRFAVRLLAKDRWFTLVAALTLGLPAVTRRVAVSNLRAFLNPAWLVGE